MASRSRVKAQAAGSRPVTPEDLKSLVQALGQLVRDSVRSEVLRLVATLENVERKALETHGYVQRLDAFTSGIDTKITDMLAREHQRLAKERDLEHRSFLGKIDLARHPEREGATMEQLRDAEKTAAAFRAGEQAQREAEARQDGIDKRDVRPVVVNGEVVREISKVDRESKEITVTAYPVVDSEVVPERPDVTLDREIRESISKVWSRDRSASNVSLLGLVMIDLKGRANHRRVQQIIDEAFEALHPKAPRGMQDAQVTPPESPEWNKRFDR